MNGTAIRRLRDKLQNNSPIYGLWITLESPSVTEMAVGLDLDFVVIDAEHGHLDWSHIAGHLRCVARSFTVALVRVAELNGGLFKRALDLGADGIVVPWIETADQLRKAVAFAHYPPRGVRGIGAERATAWGEAVAEHVATSEENVLVVPIIERSFPIEEMAAMTKVAGADLFWFGPADFSASMGFAGQWAGPGVAEQIAERNALIRQSGKHCGVLATSDEDIARRAEQGFRAIGVGMDAGLLLRSLHGALASVGRDRRLNAVLDPEL
jgi:2-keto-3-deoxy-L-rhamnonate aldolase RhmA